MKTKLTFLLAFGIFVFSGCENQTKQPSEPTTDVAKKEDMPSILTDADVREYGERLSSILTKSASDAKYSGLKTNEERFNYLIELENKETGVEQNIGYDDFKKIAHDLRVIQEAVIEPTARTSGVQTVPIASYSDYMQSFSTGERDFITYASSELNTTSDLPSFNSKIIILRQGLRNQIYSFIDYNNDRVRMLENFLTLCSGNVNQWGDNLDTFNPYNTTPNPFRVNGSDAREDSGARVSGSCRGFFKKLCIAIVTAAVAAAAGSISYGGAVLVGAAAGYILGRCCICCSCNVVCSEY